MVLSPNQIDAIKIHGIRMAHFIWTIYLGSILDIINKHGQTIIAINNWPSSTPTLKPKRLSHKFAESIDKISLKINEKPNPCNKPINPVTKIIFLCSFPNSAKNAA